MATFQDKVTRIIESWSGRTGLSNLVPGSKAYQLAEAVSFEQMQIERLLELDTQNNSILSASDQALDEIGSRFFGVDRRKEVRAFTTPDMKVVKFYVKSGNFGNINNGNNIIIPEGTVIEGSTSDSILRMRVTSQTTLDSSLSEMYVGAELIQGPADTIPAGSINTHYFKNYTQAVSGTLLVTNPVVIGTGRPIENDDNYRFRITNSLRAFAKTNTAGIHALITDIPGVSDISIIPGDNGGGTFTVYVQATSPETPDSLINDIDAALMQTIGPWVEYKVMKPNYVGLQLDITVATRYPTQYAADSTFIASIEDAVTQYVNNFYGGSIYLMDILKMIENLHNDIMNASFSSVRVYRGIGSFRSYTDLDLAADTNPYIDITNIEKVIIESVASPVLITVA